MSSVLLDTNLFILLIVGLADKSYIAKHKRTQTFTEDDFDTLVKIIGKYSQLIITSHCLSEVSNLITNREADKKDLMQNKIKQTLKIVMERTKETHISKEHIFKNNLVFRLGVADTGIIEKSKRVSLLLTIDLDLYIELEKLGRNVYNFNHIRIYGWKTWK